MRPVSRIRRLCTTCKTTAARPHDQSCGRPHQKFAHRSPRALQHLIARSISGCCGCAVEVNPDVLEYNAHASYSVCRMRDMEQERVTGGRMRGVLHRHRRCVLNFLR